MKIIRHSKECKLKGQHYDGWNYPKDVCKPYEHEKWIVHIAPDVFWFDAQAVGSYQGSVYGVGTYKKKILIYEGYFGSCSGCGGWGEGGEPESQEDLLKNCKLFKTTEEAKEYFAQLSHYDKPNANTFFKAIDAAGSYMKRRAKKTKK